VYAKIDDKISSFVVERGTPGLELPPDAQSHARELARRVVMEDCRVRPTTCLAAGGGLQHMMRNLEIERLTLAAMSLGIADAASTS